MQSAIDRPHEAPTTLVELQTRIRSMECYVPITEAVDRYGVKGLYQSSNGWHTEGQNDIFEPQKCWSEADAVRQFWYYFAREICRNELDYDGKMVALNVREEPELAGPWYGAYRVLARYSVIMRDHRGNLMMWHGQQPQEPVDAVA